MNLHLGIRPWVLLLTAAASLTACTSAPLSFVEGVPLTRTDPTLYPVRVVSLDGIIQFSSADQPLNVYPGSRSLVLAAAPGKSARGSTQKSYVLNVEPCSRYYLAAKRKSPMDSDWSLVLDHKEAVPGCTVESELKKTGAPISPNSTASSPT